uniref:Dentin sialophosphoprotein-like n=1 Tax=Drosophila rhopaloa TaxID=1041015 RepID=A0A6P4FAY6_DRORH
MVKIREDEARIPTMGSFSSNTKNVQKALLLKEVNQEPSLEKEAGAEAQENVAEPTPGKQDPGGSGTEPDKENQSPNPKRSASKDFESKIKYSEPEKEQGKGYYVLHPNQHDNIRQKSLLKSDQESGSAAKQSTSEDSDRGSSSSDSEGKEGNGNKTVSRSNQQDGNIRQGLSLKRTRVKGSLANQSSSEDSNRKSSYSQSEEEGGYNIRQGSLKKNELGDLHYPHLKIQTANHLNQSRKKKEVTKTATLELVQRRRYYPLRTVLEKKTSTEIKSEEEGGNENRTSSENSPASGSVAQRSTLVVSGRGLTSSESEEGETRNLYVLRRYYQDEQSTFEDLGSYPGSDEELSNEDWTASNQESYYIRRVAQLPTFVDSDRELSSSGTEEEEIQNLNVSQSNQEDEVKESVAEKTSSEDSDVESLYPGSEEEDDSIRVRGSLAENSDIESLASDTEEEDDTTLQRTILQRDGTKESETECKDSTSEDEQQLQDSSSLGPNASDLDPLDIHQLQDLLNSSFDESAEVTSDQEDDNKSKEEVSETDQEDTESEGDRRRDTDISSDSAPEDFREYFNFEEPHEEEREYPEGGEGYEGQGSASDEDGQEQGLSSPGKNSNDSYGSDNQQLQPLVNSNSGPNFDESDSEEEEEIAGHRKVSTPDQEDDTKSEEASVKAQESETEQEDTESEDSEEEQCDTSGDRRQDTDTNSDSDPENFREDFNCEESHENGEGYESQEPDSDENGQEQDSSSSGPNSNNSDRLDDNKSKVEVSESEEEDTESEDSEEEQGDTSGNSRRDTDTNSDSDSDPGDNRQSFNSEKSREKEHQYPKGGKGYKSQGQTFGENGKAGNRASYERVCSFTTPPKLNQALLEDHSRVKIEDIDRNLDSFIQIKRKRNPNWEKETIIKTRRVDKIFRELLKVTTVEGDTLSDFSAYGSEKSLEQVTYSLEKANKIFQLLKREQIQVTNWIERELNDLEFDIKFASAG